MFSFKARKYSSVNSEGEETSWLKNERESSPSDSREHWSNNSWYCNKSTIYAIISLFLLGLGIAIGICATIIYDEKRPWHTEEHSNLKIFNGVEFPSHTQWFNGSFFKLSQYAGNPTVQLDAAWKKWTETGNEYMDAYPALLRISRSDFEKSTMHSIDTAVKFEDAKEKSEGYMATLEMYHQIHCLGMIRKFIYWDYYAEHDPEWAQGVLLRQHSDHCLSMLLEVLLCHADTALVTYHWFSGYDAPMPDFSTPHSCRNPEAVLQWTKEHEAFPPRAIRKPEGAAQFDEMF